MEKLMDDILRNLVLGEPLTKSLVAAAEASIMINILMSESRPNCLRVRLIQSSKDALAEGTRYLDAFVDLGELR